jgi:hypothetical protein
MRRSLAYLLVLALVLAGSAMVSPSVAKKKAEDTAAAAGKKPGGDAKKDADDKKKKEKSFEDVIEDYEKVEGLFTFYVNDEEGKTYIEILPDQFDKTFLCSVTRQAGDGYFFDSSAMMGEFPFQFHRVGKAVQLRHKNVYFRANDTAAIHRALSRGLSDSIFGVSKIEGAPHEGRGSVLVDADGFFVQDVASIGYIFKEYIKEYSYSFDEKNSYLSQIRSFPKNSEIDATLHFKSGAPKNVPTLPDSRSFLHTYRYSLSELPEPADFAPRPADDRVGHFITMYQDYTSVLKDTPYVRYVNRWNLQKAEPKFEVSEPREPIVFWLENTIPVEYRDAVREGILLWNSAFERIGFKNAIVVKQQPDDADWDAADVRYNAVRWIVQPGGGYAVGPSRTNPFTGQIYDADIRVSADMIRSVFGTFEEFAKPVAIGDRYAAEMGLTRSAAEGMCDFHTGAMEQAAFGWSVVSSRAAVAGGSADMQQFLHDFIVGVIAHEVGHTLGLRHNFKASTIHPNGELQTDSAAKTGLTGSVMDYTPVNIAPNGGSQGEYWQTVLGPYDYWAIEYAYAPYDPSSGESEQAMLARIASRVADPMLAYATDEDTMGGARGIDPVSNRWDLGADPIEFYKGRVDISQELWGNLETEFETEGARYQRLRDVFNRGMTQYYISTMNVPKYVGGIYNHRDHVGDPGGRQPFVPVPAEQQRAALGFLTEEIFAEGSFGFPSELLNKLPPERFPDFSGSVWEMQRIDYPIHAIVASIQQAPLDTLYDGMRMSRILDIEVRDDDNPLTLAEMFGEVRGAIWSEVDRGANVNSFRRSLQRAHLDKLIGMVVEPAPGTPEDASTLARADLKAIEAAIGRSFDNASLDAYTRAHLDETAARIESALGASMLRKL